MRSPVNYTNGFTMIKMTNSAFAAFALIPFVSACGSSGDSPTAFSGFSNIPTDGTVQISGRGASASYAANSSGQVAISNLQTDTDATVNATSENDELMAVSMRAGGSSVSFSDSNNDTMGAILGAVAFQSANEQDLAIIANEDTLGLEYQTYGIWLTGYGTGSGTLGTGSVGTTTDAANIPAAQSARYEGASIGFAQRADGQGYATVSAMEVTTNDFASLDIRSSNTQAINLTDDSQSSATELDFAGTATLSGSEFSGTISGTGVNGNINGDFFGPNAEEVGGVFDSNDGTTIYVGSFGGVQD